MKKSSIFFTITVSFILSIVILFFSFFVIVKSNYEKREIKLYYKYLDIAKKLILKSKSKNIKNTHYEIIYDKNKIEKVIQNPNTKILVHKKSKKKDSVFIILNSDKYHFIYMQKANKTILIKDKIKIRDNIDIYIVLVFSIILITLILMYIITLKKLMPLKIFREKVQSLGDENFDFECHLKGKDEISLLAKEFKNTALKLKEKKEKREELIEKIILDIENSSDKNLKNLSSKLQSLNK